MQADKPHDADKNMKTLKKMCFSLLLDLFCGKGALIFRFRFVFCQKTLDIDIIVVLPIIVLKV